MGGARGGGRQDAPPVGATRVVDLPQSVREELHGGVEESTPPSRDSRHVGSNHDPCSVAKPAGGLRRRV